MRKAKMNYWIRLKLSLGIAILAFKKVWHGMGKHPVFIKTGDTITVTYTAEIKHD